MSSQQTTLAAVSQLEIALSRELEHAVPFREDAALCKELAREAEPVIDALRDYGSAPLPLGHEALTLLGLLGRRAGALGATPTAVLGLERALARVLSSLDFVLSDAASSALSIALLEGYVSGRDERLVQQWMRQVASANSVLELAPRVLALVVFAAGDHPALDEAFAEAERELLRRDARSLLVSLRHVSTLDEDLARLVASLCLSARGLGACVFITEASDACLDRLTRFELELALPADTSFASGVRHAFAAADLVVRPKHGWAGALFRRDTSARRR